MGEEQESGIEKCHLTQEDIAHLPTELQVFLFDKMLGAGCEETEIERIIVFNRPTTKRHHRAIGLIHTSWEILYIEILENTFNEEFYIHWWTNQESCSCDVIYKRDSIYPLIQDFFDHINGNRKIVD